MAFTPGELTNIANAALDFYYTPDGLTPRERSKRGLRAARRALQEAQSALDDALAYRDEVRRMSFSQRNTPWTKREFYRDTMYATPRADAPGS